MADLLDEHRFEMEEAAAATMIQVPEVPRRPSIIETLSSKLTGKAKMEDVAPLGLFDCHICLDAAHDPVVTSCGHLFCWSCLSDWFDAHRPNSCPACKAASGQDKVTPIYGRGREDQLDPRKRPRPNRPRPSPLQPQSVRRVPLQRAQPRFTLPGLSLTAFGFGPLGGGGGSLVIDSLQDRSRSRSSSTASSSSAFPFDFGFGDTPIPFSEVGPGIASAHLTGAFASLSGSNSPTWPGAGSLFAGGQQLSLCPLQMLGMFGKSWDWGIPLSGVGMGMAIGGVGGMGALPSRRDTQKDSTTWALQLAMHPYVVLALLIISIIRLLV